MIHVNKTRILLLHKENLRRRVNLIRTLIQALAQTPILIPLLNLVLLLKPVLLPILIPIPIPIPILPAPPMPHLKRKTRN